jgi:hypothetical protein
MGLFGSGYRSVERALIDSYTQAFSTLCGASQAECRSMAEGLVQAAIDRAKRSGAYGAGPLSSRVLENHASQTLRDARAEGVTDDDIRWWWDLDEVERQACEEWDNALHAGVFMTQTSHGFSEDDAKLAAWASHPYYGRGDPPNGLARLLPPELRRRVNAYAERYFRSHAGDPAPTAGPDGHRTYNEWVRSEIRKGLL